MSLANSPGKNQKLFFRITLISLSAFSLLAGLIGFKIFFQAHGEEDGWLRIIYRTIQLFMFKGGDFPEPYPWLLQAGRFTAPLSTMMALILGLLELFKEQLNRFRMARMKNHVLIIGLGNKGINVMRESLGMKEKVLVIESDPLNPHITSARALGCAVLVGDASNKHSLKKARIKHASLVYLLMGEDSLQVRTYMCLCKLSGEERGVGEEHPAVVMHLQNQDLLHMMRNHNLFGEINQGRAPLVFNVYENSARELFIKTPPDNPGITEESDKHIQIFIFGFGQAGEALALQTALTGHYMNKKKPRVVVIDRRAETLAPDFLKRYPSFKESCDLDYLALEAHSPQLSNQLLSFLENPQSLNTMVLCFDNETQNILLGLQLERIKFIDSDQPLKIFVRTENNESFASLSKNIRPYGMPSNVCSREVIFGDSLDTIAKASHQIYLDSRKQEADFGQQNADVTWDQLSQEYRDSNRKLADHMAVKARSIGCEIVSSTDPRPAATLSNDEIESLSQLEHRRWNAERSLAGWNYSPVKNSGTRQTPYLTDWKNLEENIKDYDRDTVRNIPDVLGLVDLKIARKPLA